MEINERRYRIDKLRNNVEIVFPILVILQIITSVFAQKADLNLPQIKEIQAVMINSNPSIRIVLTIIIIGIIVAYFIFLEQNKALEELIKIISV